MMASLAQNFQPGGIQQHPGVPQGHPMGVPHNPNQQLQGPGMPQQMHMGVSGPGPQVSQPGAMMAGMPQGVGGPSAHALQHLNPGQAQQAQAHIYQQQQMFANNPQLAQQMQQHQIMQQQRQAQARQQMLQQQYSGGVPQGMPNGMNQMQFNAMRAGGPMSRPVNINLPQHLQQQQQQVAQQQAQHSIEQQQAQAQAQHQHNQQILAAQQQMAMQQQANAQAQVGGNHAQPNPMNPQQIQSMQQAQMAAAQQAHHQQQQQQQHAAANAQNQPQPQPQVQQPQPNPQALAQQQQAQNQQPNMQAQQAAAMLQQQQQRQGERGQCLLQLISFADHLSNFGGAKQRDDLQYWLEFVNKFFSPKGVLRHAVWIMEENTNKQYEITFPALARYFHTHFESGVKNMQMIMERGQEKPLPNGQHYVESPKTSFVYWFDNGYQLIANGTLKAHFDSNQKIELFEFITTGHEEFIPRQKMIEAARPIHEWTKEWKHLNSPDGKSSPELNKKKSKATKSPAQAPPEFEFQGDNKVKHSMGITHSVFQFLEFVEVLGQMNPLFGYSHQNANLAPYSALEQYVSTVVANGNHAGQSPALGQPGLPGSPHVDGSPAIAPGMLPQHSQQTHSSSNSVQTSPQNTNKRRRPSAVKIEDDNNLANGAPPKSANSVKASPRVGKRQKGNPV